MHGTDAQMSVTDVQNRYADDASKHFTVDGSAKCQGPGSDQPISP